MCEVTFRKNLKCTHTHGASIACVVTSANLTECTCRILVPVTCKVTFSALTEMHLHALKAMSQESSDMFGALLGKGEKCQKLVGTH